jgi:hypothetical protein
MTTHTMGEEGFRWFFGIVEDRDDPKKIGRLRVRIFNVHPFTSSGEPDKVDVPTDHLPWAIPVNSIISAGILDSSKDGVGLSPTGIMLGTTVFGFFADGNECQTPIILGTTAGIVGSEEDNELPKSAIDINSAGSLKTSKQISAASPFPGEPPSPYGAKYPYNRVLRTESGHLIEVDDTTSKERIHIMHKSGTYVEIDNTGQIVIKSIEDRFDITTKDNNVYIGGDANVRIKGNVNIIVDGNVDATVKGNANVKVNGNFNTKVDGTYTVESGGNMLLKAPKIDLNP